MTATPFVENAIVENTLFKTEIAETVQLYGHLNHPDVVVDIDGESAVILFLTIGVHDGYSEYHYNDDVSGFGGPVSVAPAASFRSGLMPWREMIN